MPGPAGFGVFGTLAGRSPLFGFSNAPESGFLIASINLTTPSHQPGGVNGCVVDELLGVCAGFVPGVLELADFEPCAVLLGVVMPPELPAATVVGRWKGSTPVLGPRETSAEGVEDLVAGALTAPEIPGMPVRMAASLARLVSTAPVEAGRPADPVEREIGCPGCLRKWPRSPR